MDCPRCNLPVGGKTFGNELSEYGALLRRIWNDGSLAFVADNTIDSYERSPFDSDKEPAKHMAWMGGVYYARMRKLEHEAKNRR